MTSRVFAEPLPNVSIPIERDPSSPDNTELDEDETEKKATQTIYAKLKQVACNPKPEEHWERVEKDLNDPKYRHVKKRIVQKLDNDNNYAPIHYAVLSNNSVICQELLSDDYECNVNLLGWNGQTPLHLAACSSAIEEEMKCDPPCENSIMIMLLNHKRIRVNIKDDKGRTPLHHAIMRNHTNIVRKLCAYGANPKVRDIQGATPIHYAYRFGTKNNIDSIFSLRPAYSDMKTVDHKNPIDVAAEYGHIDALLKYFDDEKNSLPKHSNHTIRAFIDLAVRHRDITLLPEDFQTQNERNISYIIRLACRHPNGHELLDDLNLSGKISETLLSKQRPADRFTPLMIAVKYQNVECVQYFLRVSHPRTDQILRETSLDFQRTVFHICAEIPNKKITDLLLEQVKPCKIDLTLKDVMGNTPLHICVEKENQYMCDKLLQIATNSMHSGSTARSNSVRSTNNSSKLPQMLTVRNNNGLTSFHLATEKGSYDIVRKMTEIVSNPESLIENRDEQLRTSLHIAAFQGNEKIVQLFIDLEEDVNVNMQDVDDNTPLHEAARWSDLDENDNIHRIECVDRLINAGADVNALNIQRETPLHVACRYSSSALVKKLLDHRADYLQTNFRGYNCFEVAIEEKNEEVVKYLINHDIIFELMRNAQINRKRFEPCCTCGNETFRESCCVPACKGLQCCSYYTIRVCSDGRIADTPMRKLIIKMPDMAYEVLERCTTTIGSEKSQIHQQTFDYEFLEDQYVVDNWAEGNANDRGRAFHKPSSDKKTNNEKNEPYSNDSKILIMRHPLFLMAVNNRYRLMEHPLSKSLVMKKLCWFNIIFFVIISLLYVAFLSVFTVIISRTKHPQHYYNLTNFTFGLELCAKVMATLGDREKKETSDIELRVTLYITSALVAAKSIWYILAFLRIHWTKAFTFLPELAAVACSLYYIYDYDFQTKYKMRCPPQWSVGAAGLFSGYMAMFYYIQYVPVFGTYVIMMRQIFIRFILFLPVLMVLLLGFTLALYMTFPNFEVFNNIGVGLAKTAIMGSGEIDYNDFMYDEDTPSYYEVGYVLLPFFAVAIAVLASNLLIGLAVNEVTKLSAKNVALDKLYELVADLEIFKRQLTFWRRYCCKSCFVRPNHYERNDLKDKWIWFSHFKKDLLELFAQEVKDDDRLSGESGDEEKHDKYSPVLHDIQTTLKEMNKLPENVPTERMHPRKIHLVRYLKR